jgi:hypothetical protein
MGQRRTRARVRRILRIEPDPRAEDEQDTLQSHARSLAAREVLVTQRRLTWRSHERGSFRPAGK